MILRILLLLLLPVIAIVIYLEGQKYNPALIDFKSSQTYKKLSFFPPSMEGYNQVGQMRTYTKENLYEYINGHAEYFIGAGFVGLYVGEYIKTGNEQLQPDASIELYDMGKSLHAFGVLVDEAGENTPEINKDMMGIKTSRGISFFAGQYYIKINKYNDEVPVEKFASNIEDKIINTDTFKLFARFPEIGKTIKTRFIKDSYRGLDFLHNIIEREYMVDDENIQVFLIEGEEKEIDKVTSLFLDYFQKSEIKFDKLKENGKNFYKIMDTYEGDWYLLPLSDMLFGIYGSNKNDIVKHFIK